MARGAAYWSARRRKQGGRAAGKVLKAFGDPTPANMARAAWSGVKYLRTLINSEVHKVDNGPTSQAIGTTATIVHLTGIAQGDTASGRTGNSILMKYMSLKFFLTINASATASLVRIVIFVDKQQVSDTSASTTDILQSNSTVAFLNNSQAGRFMILKDYFVALDSAGKPSRTMKWFKSFAGKDFHVKYNGAAGTDIQQNGIYILMLSSEATNTPTLTYNIRVAWHDN